MVETLLKNWKLIAILVVIAICITAWQADRKAEYRRGRDEMAAEISGRLKDAAIEKAKEDRETSTVYQAGKAVREEKERVRYVQVPKLVERVVYRNVCVDSDGVSRRRLNRLPIWCSHARNYLNLTAVQARMCCRGRCKSSGYIMTVRRGIRRCLILLNKAKAV